MHICGEIGTSSAHFEFAGCWFSALVSSHVVCVRTENFICWRKHKQVAWYCFGRPQQCNFGYVCILCTLWYIISYPLFADADTGIYPHAASQYHARPKAKRGIAMLNVDKFPYPRQQTRGNEFIPCSNNICDILKRFHSFKIPVIPLIWSKSPYKHSVTRPCRSGKESGRWSESHCDVINDVPLFLYLTLMTSNVRYASILYGC